MYLGRIFVKYDYQGRLSLVVKPKAFHWDLQCSAETLAVDECSLCGNSKTYIPLLNTIAAPLNVISGAIYTFAQDDHEAS